MHAYNELYLCDAKENLGWFFDYHINDCHMEPDYAMDCFLQCRLSEEFSRGNPAVVSGMSGMELAMWILQENNPETAVPQVIYPLVPTPEYWAGWALAEYQWLSGRSFRDIINHISFSEVLSLYHVYHEMDTERFCEYMEMRCGMN